MHTLTLLVMVAEDSTAAEDATGGGGRIAGKHLNLHQNEAMGGGRGKWGAANQRM